MCGYHNRYNALPMGQTRQQATTPPHFSPRFDPLGECLEAKLVTEALEFALRGAMNAQWALTSPNAYTGDITIVNYDGNVRPIGVEKGQSQWRALRPGDEFHVRDMNQTRQGVSLTGKYMGIDGTEYENAQIFVPNSRFKQFVKNVLRGAGYCNDFRGGGEVSVEAAQPVYVAQQLPLFDPIVVIPMALVALCVIGTYVRGRLRNLAGLT